MPRSSLAIVSDSQAPTQLTNMRPISEGQEHVLFTQNGTFVRTAPVKPKSKNTIVATHWVEASKALLGEIRCCNTKNDPKRPIAELVDNPHILHALEIEDLKWSEDGGTCTEKLVHLKAATAFKDRKTKDSNEELSMRARFDPAMLWPLNAATLSAIATRIDDNPEFYESISSVDVSELMPRVYNAIKTVVEESQDTVIVGNPTLDGWKPTTEFGDVDKKGAAQVGKKYSTFTHADPPMSKRLREIHDDIAAKDDELKRIKTLVSDIKTTKSGETCITLNIKNAKCVTTDGTVVVVGNAEE